MSPTKTSHFALARLSTFATTAIACTAFAAALGCGGADSPDPKMPMNSPAPAVETPPPPETASTTPAVDMPPNKSAADTAPLPVAPTTPAPPSLTDEQILAITNTLNSAEVEEGKVAAGKAKNGEVKKYAQMMVKHHGEAKTKQAALVKKAKLTPQESDMTAALVSENKKGLDELKTKSGSDFDKSYVDAQIKEHKEVLDTIDTKLIPQAKSADVKTFVAGMRPTIVHHLEEAQKLQTLLNK